MSLRYLADTNVLVDLLRHREHLDRRRFADAAGRVAVSVVTVMELEYGTVRSTNPVQNRAEVEALLSLFAILDLTRGAAEHAGQVRAAGAAAGTPIGPYDSLLAGQARSLGLTLVTNNLREFSRVPGLLVEDWTVY
ncbi:MAG: type II toxin-antitoxin system VapC family toxin [Bifidobacteriaceae bacterium]|nr:type II toxin-antitoxin system VapC family toxin [Bifidobacteriaceae bacterium]